jgi:hypothetical protein
VLPQGLWSAGFVLFGWAILAVLLRGVTQCLQGRADRMDAELTSRSYQEEADETLHALGVKSTP